MKRKPLFTLHMQLITGLLSLFFLQDNAFAYIHPSAPSAAHELEHASAAVHGYLHDHYASTYGAHELEDATTELHHVLHEWSEGRATESQVTAHLRTTTDAWKAFRKQLRLSGLLHTDSALKKLFNETKSAYKRVRFLLRKASDLSFIHPNAPAASHELEEVAHALHGHLHDHYSSSYGAHDFETATHALHETLHLWSQAMATERQVSDRLDAVRGAWKDMRRQMRQAGLLNGSDQQLTDLLSHAKDAYQRVRRLLRGTR